MNFASRITRTPRAHNPEIGQEALKVFTAQPPEIRALIGGAAGCSPFLDGLIGKERDWLNVAISGPPESAFDLLVRGLDLMAPADLAPALRQAKRRVALLTALADLGGVWNLEQTTGALTEFADRAVDLAMKSLVRAEILRGKLPGQTESDVAVAGGMVALAMGKMGAGELNYSSDIDLICLFDESRFSPDEYHDARASFIRVTRRMSAMLSDLTGDGYVFRTDLRLRPDPSVTPVCLSMEAAERYYESVGRTWERAAHIKARPCGGDLKAGEIYLERLRPFVWRKHLDFAAIQDAHDMRLRIRDHKGFHGALVLEGHNMKLGRGGIREIEFFTQTRQIIAGGRDADLRDRRTLPALATLAQKGWVPDEVAQTLTGIYRSHREIEHRLQMINDAQTHDLPKNDDGFARLAAFMDRDIGELRADLTRDLTRVHDLTEGFFAPTEVDDTPELAENLAQTVARWHTYPAMRSQRAQEIFARIKPELLKRLNRAAKPDEALLQFDGFLAGLPAGVQLFSLFEANPQLIDLIVDIAATAPALARHLSRNAQVFDAVIGGGFFETWPGLAALRTELTAVLDAIDDYEGKLDALRRWTKEWHFRIGVHHLRGLISGQEAGQEYADLAEAAVSVLWAPVVGEFARKHGPPPGRGAAVLGMGSLGAARLHARSDLDLIVIYDADGAEVSVGKRPLATRPYYARLTQALVTALTAQMAEGRVYEVDMRLRPSGRQGPVATSLQSFRDYQQNQAWVWEHLALTRARMIAGDAALGRELETFRKALLMKKADAVKIRGEVAEMRARIAEAKSSGGLWEAKLGAGRLQDIELAAQSLALMAGDAARETPDQIAAGQRAGFISGADAQTLARGYDLMWRLQLASKLLTDDGLDLDEVGEGGRAFLLREMGFSDVDSLAKGLNDHKTEASKVILALLSGSTAGGTT